MTIKLTQVQFDYISVFNYEAATDKIDLQQPLESWALNWLAVNAQRELNALLDDFDNNPLEERNWYKVWDTLEAEDIPEFLRQGWKRWSQIEVWEKTYDFYYWHSENRILILQGARKNDWKKINWLYTILKSCTHYNKPLEYYLLRLSKRI